MCRNNVLTNTISKLYLFCFLVIPLLTNSCTVQFVAQYDETIKNEIVRISGEVDKFYVELLETKESERPYENCKEKYVAIEVDLNMLLTKNEIRALNDESIKQNQIALKLWLDDKEQHKKNNNLSDATINIHRSQFKRIFVAMAKGEEAKR